LLSIDISPELPPQLYSPLFWIQGPNDISSEPGIDSDIYKIIALYIFINTPPNENITSNELEEIIQLAYDYDLYTILLMIKDKYNPVLINEAIAAVKQDMKPTQSSAIIQNICKDILLQNTYQWKADNRMIYGKLIGFITTAKFDPYNYFTKLELDQIKQENNNKLENNLSVSKFLSAIKDKLQEEFKDYKSELNSLIGRIEKIEERIGLSQSSHVKMLNDSRDTKLYTDIIIEF
jgi:FtsZ-binding cell division protein ZapB